MQMSKNVDNDVSMNPPILTWIINLDLGPVPVEILLNKNYLWYASTFV